tara:strand:+ start:156 stop:1397 length:1242 start_codon:yes stop_codon:yes gene_type:complete
MFRNLGHKTGHKMDTKINDKRIIDLLRLNPKSVRLVEAKKNRNFKLSFYYGMKENKKPIQKDVSLTHLDYYHNPTNPFERQQNKVAKDSAQIILEQVRTNMRENTYPILRQSRPLGVNENDFIKFYQDEVDNNKTYRRSTVLGHLSVIKHLKEFIKDDRLGFNAISPQFIIDFYNYMARDSVNTKGTKNALDTAGKYHRRFYNYLGMANRAGLVELPPQNPVKYAKEKPKQSDYLTSQELKALANTQEEDFTLKSAFLFSCATGLAHQELVNLKHSNIYQKDGGEFEIHLVRQKTEEPNKIPLNETAMAIINKRKEVFGSLPDDKVFKNLYYSGYQNTKLQLWVDRAGIKKKITYHCGRHTFSALHYLAYKDVGALKNLLGHQDISTTQRYLAKLLKNYHTETSKLPTFNFDI